MAAQWVLFVSGSCRTCMSSYQATAFRAVSRAFASSSTRFVNRQSKNVFSGLQRDNPARKAHSFTSAAVSKDVVLFEHDRTRFFRLLAVFCGGQFLFWVYLAHFAFTSLRDTRTVQNEAQKIRTDLGGLLSFDMNLGSDVWRYGFTFGCLIIGGALVGVAALFGRRSVSRVILHKGGGTVTVCTQSPLGPRTAHRVTVPLSEVACHAHRQESPSFIPLKVKGYKFYFLLDKDGSVYNPKLFDISVGAYRPL